MPGTGGAATSSTRRLFSSVGSA